jgi:tetratricopeptide (TPR) repeat protein
MKKMNILSIAIVMVTTIFSFSSCMLVQTGLDKSKQQEREKKLDKADELTKQGNGSRDQEDYKKAIKYYTEAVELYVEARSLVETFPFDSRDVAIEKRHNVDKEIAKRQAYALYQRGNVYDKLGDTKQAQDDWRRALELDPIVDRIDSSLQ